MIPRHVRRQAQRERLKGNSHLELSGPIADRMCWVEVVVSPPPQVVDLLAPGARRDEKTRALIDTGATQSGIRGDLATALALPTVGASHVSTGNGTVQCAVVAANIAIGANGRKFVQVVNLAVLPMQVPLLFGMDLMHGGVLTIDSVAGIWRWELRRAQGDF